MPDQYETRPSQMLGEYRLVRKLGGGGFGTVYQAEHAHEHAQVAIKILQVPLTKSEDFRDFLNETRTMIRLRHPHITPLLDVGLSREDFPFLVMEYATQGTLQDRHPRGSQVPLATVAEYVEQIASALQYAHDHRVIHRDVKPENMLLRVDGTLLLSDFGIAKIMEQSTLVSMQKQMGTPAYMAPEQHKGYPCFASDQYALAVVAYEWISGTRPFHGSREWLAVQHVTAPLPSLQKLIPTFPQRIEEVIFKALSKEPEQRFATVQEFATAFRTAVEETTTSDIEIKNPPPDEAQTKETFIQLPATTGSKQTESDIQTPPIPELPHTDLPAEPEIEPIREDPDHLTSPLSSGQPDTPHPNTYTPALPATTTERSPSAVKALRRLTPLSSNLFLLISLAFIGLITLALFMNAQGINLQNLQKSQNTVSIHSTNNAQVLNTSTVSRLVKKWTFQTASNIESSPALANDVAYIGSDDGNIYAIDTLSGHQKWAFPTGGPVISSPAIAKGLVYVGSDDGNVYAIDEHTGQQKWVFHTESIVHSSPAVVNGTVYIGAADGNVYAIDALSGQQKWDSYTGSPISASSNEPPGVPHGPPPPLISTLPAIVAGVVYISAPDHNIYALDAQSGNQKWTFPTAGPVVSSPTVVDGVVYVGSLDRLGFSNKHIYAIDAQSGIQKWVFSMTGSALPRPPAPQNPPPAVTSSPVVVDGVVYVGSDSKNVYAIDTQSGTPKWVFQANGPVVSSPAVVNGVIYFGSLEPFGFRGINMYAIDTQSGNQKWSFKMGGAVFSSPTVANNSVYVGSADGNVYAFGLPATTS